MLGGVSWAASDFSCPDDQALQLLNIAVNPTGATQFDGVVSAYTYVIQNARRAMDEPAPSSACFRLAQLQWAALNCSSMHCPRLPNRDIEFLKVEFPILQKCPSRSIHRDEYLPIVRYAVIPSDEILAKQVTGWVLFDLKISPSGSVKEAVVVESTEPILNGPSTDAVLQFKYKPFRDEHGRPTSFRGVQATVHTTYFDLARAVGCEWNDPRYQ